MGTSSTGAQFAGGLAIFVFAVALWIGMVASYVTHLVWAVGILISQVESTIGVYILAVCGALFPPLGMTHGVILWVL